MFRVIFHLDMDAFYASIEQRDNPSLRGRPVIVGSPPTQRGVVCAASYEARKFGVRSAMPSVTAGRLCPKGVFVRPRMEHYREESGRIMAIVAHTGALIEQVSIDEVYLDLPEVAGQASRMAAARDATVTDGPAAPLNADEALYLAVPLARELKRRILAERGLTASIGIATNKLLAKLASDFNKPDGLTLIPERDKSLWKSRSPKRKISIGSDVFCWGRKNLFRGHCDWLDSASAAWAKSQAGSWCCCEGRFGQRARPRLGEASGAARVGRCQRSLFSGAWG